MKGDFEIMSAFIYEDVIPSPIANANVQKAFYNGAHLAYFIAPMDGYVLHDKANDWTDIDPETMEEVYMLGYASGTVTCGANYDFTANPREFYAVPENSVPADHIFGGG